MPVYKEIKWWDGAFHVFESGRRIGIVNRRIIRVNGKIDRTVWFSHNRHFFSVKGEYATRTDAAMAIPRGTIRQPVDAFS